MLHQMLPTEGRAKFILMFGHSETFMRLAMRSPHFTVSSDPRYRTNRSGGATLVALLRAMQFVSPCLQPGGDNMRVGRSANHQSKPIILSSKLQKGAYHITRAGVQRRSRHACNVRQHQRPQARHSYVSPSGTVRTELDFCQPMVIATLTRRYTVAER